MSKLKQSTLLQFSENDVRADTHLYIVRPGEDRNVRIGNHIVPLSFLAELFRLFFSGSSTRDLVDHFAKQGYGFSFVTYWKWIQTLSHLLYVFCFRIRPAVADLWFADEMRIGKRWLVFVSDKATHFILSIRVIKSRSIAQFRKILKTARTVAGKCPEEFRTDGCPAYRKSSDEVFGKDVHDWKTKDEPGGLAFTNYQEGSLRATRARIDSMTSFHGTIAEDNDLAEGYMIYHDYVDKSPSLTSPLPSLLPESMEETRGSVERTPAEAAAIQWLGDDPTLTLLWNALATQTHIPLRKHQPQSRKKVTLARWISPSIKVLPQAQRRRSRRHRRNILRDAKIPEWCEQKKAVRARHSSDKDRSECSLLTQR